MDRIESKFDILLGMFSKKFMMNNIEETGDLTFQNQEPIICKVITGNYDGENAFDSESLFEEVEEHVFDKSSVWQNFCKEELLENLMEPIDSNYIKIEFPEGMKSEQELQEITGKESQKQTRQNYVVMEKANFSEIDVHFETFHFDDCGGKEQHSIVLPGSVVLGLIGNDFYEFGNDAILWQNFEELKRVKLATITAKNDEKPWEEWVTKFRGGTNLGEKNIENIQEKLFGSLYFYMGIGMACLETCRCRYLLKVKTDILQYLVKNQGTIEDIVLRKFVPSTITAGVVIHSLSGRTLTNTCDHSKIFILHTSFGGTFSLDWLKSSDVSLNATRAVAICSPWNLLMGSRFIGLRLIQKLYDRALTIGLRDYTQLYPLWYFRLVIWKGIKKSSSIRNFDTYSIYLVENYETVDTYYRHCCSFSFVGRRSVPLFNIRALDYPVCTSEAILFDECKVTKHARHLAFFKGVGESFEGWRDHYQTSGINFGTEQSKSREASYEPDSTIDHASNKEANFKDVKTDAQMGTIWDHGAATWANLSCIYSQLSTILWIMHDALRYVYSI